MSRMSQETSRCRLCGGDPKSVEAPEKRREPRRVYSWCEECGFVELHPEFRPTPEAERERYLEHNNSADNRGYIDFLTRFIDAAFPRAGHGNPHDLSGLTVLDFGSGPNPVLAELLALRGADVDVYDPFFAPDRTRRNVSYDVIILHEVIEHLFEPMQTLQELQGRLVADGQLLVRTLFHPRSPQEFLTWRYRRDTTHVCFFAPRTMSWIGREVLGRRTVTMDPDITIFGPAVVTP